MAEVAYFALIVLMSFLSDNSGQSMDIIKEKGQKEIRAIYMNANTAGNVKKRDALVAFMKSAKLNGVVIDVKDSTGKVFFKSQVPLANITGAERPQVAKDLKSFLENLKKEKIYAIARIAVFEDPNLAEKIPEIAIKKKNGGLWRDRKGLAWVDPASPVVWKYNMDIARSAMLLGFDELNFDYIRFPTDGNMDDIAYPVYSEKEKKTFVMAQFFNYMRSRFKNFPVYLSVDLFGMTLLRGDGIGIGQRYQDVAEYADFISPMVYPSHYPDNFEGYANPADHPYEIVYNSLIKARDFLKTKKAKIRPWLQDFDIGAVYDREKIQAQIKASHDAGGFGYMFWNASNVYTQEAF